MSGFFDHDASADCADCGMPMALVRTDVSAPIATLARMECVACSATGTVEIRPETDSVAAETEPQYHGAAVPQEVLGR